MITDDHPRGREPRHSTIDTTLRYYVDIAADDVAEELQKWAPVAPHSGLLQYLVTTWWDFGRDPDYGGESYIMSRILQPVVPYRVAKKCERQELNLHGFPHWILSPARLPIPPLSQTLENKHFSRCTTEQRATLYRLFVLDFVPGANYA